MNQQLESETARRPVAMGCTLTLLSLVLAVAFVGGCIAFAESGADDGKTVLRDADSYDYDTIEFVGERNLFVARTAAGELFAYADLDAANRASSVRQCRAQVVHPADPANARLQTSLAGRFSAEAGGSKILLREACNDAVYDAAGVRLDQDGRNLDRFTVSIDRQNRVVVDVSKRMCSAREEQTLRVKVSC